MARKLFELSEKTFFRTGKQCRERWLNHLDPQKKQYCLLLYMCSGDWEADEDRKIADYILSVGRKWSDIAKKLGSHRTEHMIKNRYKTLIIKMKKSHRSTKN